MNNKFGYILLLLFCSCLNNNPEDLVSNGKKEFFDNEKKFDELKIVLDEIFDANKGIASHLFVQSKQYNVDYSEKHGDFYETRSCPIKISNKFIKTANELELDDIWLNENYYKFNLAENYSTEYYTFFIFIKNKKYINQNFVYQTKLSDDWIIGVKKK